MPYMYLILAIALELVATTLLKYSEGFSKLPYTLGCIVSYMTCFFFLSKAIRHIDLSVAYATWCGLGIVATTIISIFVFKSQLNFMSFVGVFFVVFGVVILNLYGTAH